MNPALDVSAAVGRVRPEQKLRCGPSRFDPGGGGVNVSRAIANLGGTSVALVPLGGPTGDAYRTFVQEQLDQVEILPIRGTTRESFTVDELSTGHQFRFVLQGPTWEEAEWQRAFALVKAHVRSGGYLVASGSLPPGVPMDFYARLARVASEAGAMAVVDASGTALVTAVEAGGLFLIKPSRDELAELLGCPEGMDDGALIHAARSLVERGACQIVALTLGAGGAALITRERVHRLPTPAVEAVSTVGAGDSFLAALILRLAQGRTLPDAFRSAVAAGSATAMLPATGLCRAADVARLEASLERVSPGV